LGWEVCSEFSAIGFPELSLKDSLSFFNRIHELKGLAIHRLEFLGWSLFFCLLMPTEQLTAN
jgi:hypothetical protein